MLLIVSLPGFCLVDWVASKDDAYLTAWVSISNYKQKQSNISTYS